MSQDADLNKPCTAFAGQRLIKSGLLREIVPEIKATVEAGETAPVLIFDDETGRQVELDLRQSAAEILAGLDKPPTVPEVRGPGRPKLGVEAREITLLPRHWEWLQSQPGGASATLRKLVETARKEGNGEVRNTQNAIHRFMWAMTGDLQGFEDASRAFFAGDYARMDAIIDPWPADLRDHVRHLVKRLRQAEPASTTPS
jgi:hypothetical protein